jgi:hypothetical protein
MRAANGLRNRSPSNLHEPPVVHKPLVLRTELGPKGGAIHSLIRSFKEIASKEIAFNLN